MLGDQTLLQHCLGTGGLKGPVPTELAREADTAESFISRHRRAAEGKVSNLHTLWPHNSEAWWWLRGVRVSHDSGAVVYPGTICGLSPADNKSC